MADRAAATSSWRCGCAACREASDAARRSRSSTRCNLADAAEKRPHELSGGMRQRVALARALAQDRPVLLMDEPFAALDAITRDLLHEELERVWRATGRTIVFVTHNVREAARLGQRVVLLSSRPGRVVAGVADRRDDRPRASSRPRSPRSRSRSPSSCGRRSAEMPHETPADARRGLDRDSVRIRADGRAAQPRGRPRPAADRTERAGRARWRRFAASVVPPFVFVALAHRGVAALCRHRPAAPRHRARRPVDVWNAMGTRGSAGRLQEAVITSLERGIIGFLIAIIVGTPIGLLLAEVRPLRRAVGPIISGLQVLPSVAWVPAAIIWFGLSDADASTSSMLMGAIPRS